MTVIYGPKLLGITACFLLLFSASAHAQTDLSKYKTQLDAAAAAAKPVAVVEKPVTAPPPKVAAIDEAELQDIDETALIPAPAEDAAEIAPLRLSLDKPEIIRLDRDAVNVVVGSNENLRVVPDTNKTLLLIAKKPGSTYFQALDVDGKVIMQRHVIIGSPRQNYIRIRRACANGAEGCKQYSVYYCPDMCHEVNVVQDRTGPGSAIPEETPAGQRAQARPSADEPEQGGSETGSENITPPVEPPPGE